MSKDDRRCHNNQHFSLSKYIHYFDDKKFIWHLVEDNSSNVLSLVNNKSRIKLNQADDP